MRATKFDPHRTNESAGPHQNNRGDHAEAAGAEQPPGPNGHHAVPDAPPAEPGPAVQYRSTAPVEPVPRYDPAPHAGQSPRYEPAPHPEAAHRYGPAPPPAPAPQYRSGALPAPPSVAEPSSRYMPAPEPRYRSPGPVASAPAAAPPAGPGTGYGPAAQPAPAAQYRSTAPVPPAPVAAPQPTAGPGSRYAPAPQPAQEPRYRSAAPVAPAPAPPPVADPGTRYGPPPQPAPEPGYRSAAPLPPAPGPPPPVADLGTRYGPPRQQAPEPQYRSAAPLPPAPGPPPPVADPGTRYGPPPHPAPEPQFRSTAPLPAASAAPPVADPRTRYGPPPQPAPEPQHRSTAPVAPAPGPPPPRADPGTRYGPPPQPAAGPQYRSTASALPAVQPVPARPSQAAPSPGPGVLPGGQREAPIEIERIRYEDLPGVVDVVNADLPPGQPSCNRQALDLALRGESPVDANWWNELANVQGIVARRGGTVIGAASFAMAPTDRSGWLLWLHAREDRPVVEALVDRAMADLAGCSHFYAFWIATALTLGLEALPCQLRPVTHEVLQARGLAGRDSWRYLVAPLEAGTIDAGEEIAAVVPVAGPGDIPGWRFTVGDPEQPLASAEVALGRESCGVLWWIDVEPSQRGRGIGRRLLRQALRFLALRGARSVAAFVDHDDPRERDRLPAIRLLGSQGFRDVDHLWSYESPRKRLR